MSQFTFFPASGGGTGYAQLQDDDSPTPNPIGSPVAIPAGTTVPITAPDGSVQPKDSAGTNIGSAVAVKSNGTANAPIADSAVTVNGASFASVKATQGLNVPVKDDAGTAVGAKVGSEWIVKRDPLILDFTDSYQYSQLITINAYNAGTFNTPSTSGSMGTLTYSKNGGAYVAIATPGTFAIGDTVRFLRTSTGTAQLVWQR